MAPTPATSKTSARQSVSKPGLALVTGASAGLGAEIARLFAKDGHDLVLVARRRDRLEALAEELTAAHDVNAHVIVCDLSESSAPAQLHATIEDEGLAVEYLVNNAGFGSNGAFAELDADRELQMIDLNVRSLVHLTRLFVPSMIERGSGRILNLGSTAGFQGGPFMATYYASKAFVNHFSEALHTELKGSGVTVTVSCPGATATEFGDISGNGKSKLFAKGVADAEGVASHAYVAMLKGARMAVPGIKNKLLVQSLRLAPRAAILSIAAKLNSKA